MRPSDRQRASQINRQLQAFARAEFPLPGIASLQTREAFVEQVVESIRRIEYITAITAQNLSDLRRDPRSPLFDPLKGALVCMRDGEIDEAFWLVFLSVHFGKHGRDGWRLTREIYGALGLRAPWTWASVSAGVNQFRNWLNDNRDGVTGRFGNHRKYESLDARSAVGTGAVVESYVRWIRPLRTHQILIRECSDHVGLDRRILFDSLYHSMSAVIRFGRTARFDYLTMLGKLGLAAIEPGSVYMEGATGPFTGACLLFAGVKNAQRNRTELDAMLVRLGARLNLGMQVLEDALCNWQKNPGRFVRFRG